MRNDLVRKENNIFGLDPFFDDFFDFPVFEGRKNHHPVMQTDIKENDDSYELIIDVPGMKKEDINISLDNGYLTVSAVIKKEDTSNHRDVRQERYYGSYKRSFYVGDIDESQIDAKLEEGVLTITLPKEEKKAPAKKLIEIK